MANEPPEADAAKPRRLSSRSIGLLVATGVFGALAGLSLLVPAAQEQEAMTPPAGFDLQGHRGTRGLAPENTMPAFERALAIGVTTLEMDMGLTRDGVLVVHHDPRLNPERTRGPDGEWISEEEEPPALLALNYDELARYDIGRARPGSRVAERFSSQQGFDGIVIPKLESVIARAEELSGGTIRYNVETKLTPLDAEVSPGPEAFAEAVITLLRESGVAERSSVQSFDWRTLALIQERAPEITTVYLTVEQPWFDTLEKGKPGASPWTAGRDVDSYDASVPRLIKDAGGSVWSPFYRDLREVDLREARRLGLRVIVWTVNEPDDMASLIELGVDGIITDYPDRLRLVMEEKAMALPPAFPAGGVN